LSQSHFGFAPELYAYGSVSLSDPFVASLPEKEPEYDAARIDLQCWPEVYKKLGDAELLLSELKTETKKARERALQAIRSLMERYGLPDRGGAVVSFPRWSDDERILSLLVLRQISEGGRYVKPAFGLQNGQWICILNPASGQSEGGLVWSVGSQEEAEPLLKLFDNFETKMDDTMGEQGYYARL